MNLKGNVSTFIKDNKGINLFFAFLSACLFLTSCIPVVYVGLFNYATGDDLLYGSVVKRALAENVPFLDMIKLAMEDVINEYYSFQGTWSSQFLWRFEPSIFGEKCYIITVFIALFSILLGTYYFMKVVLVESGFCDSITLFTILNLLMFFSIQYMPYPRGGIYWFTGMTHYTFPYGLTLFGLGLAIKFLRNGSKKYLVGIILICFYIGGSGYPSVVICGIGVSYCIAVGVFSNEGNMQKRAVMLFVPAVILLIGFAISAMAPGNNIRGGEGYYFSFGRVFYVIYKCLYEGIIGGIKYFLVVRPLFLLPVGVIILSLQLGKRVNVTTKKMALTVVLGLILVCMVRSPEIYAGDTVVAGISGGVYDTYYYITLLYIVIVSMLLGMRVGTRINNIGFEKIKTGYLVVAILFCMCFGKHLIGNSLIYNCLNYIAAGHLADYDKQMKERISILNTTKNDEVILPFINDEQGPLMHMPVTVDESNYTNYVTAKFYGKKSVIGMDRKEWELRK